MKEVIINTCFGGFGLSDLAYEKLIEYGVPVRKYSKEPRNPKTGRYDIPVPENEGCIFDRELTPEGEDDINDLYYKYPGARMTQRYWETWINKDRSNPLLIKVVRELKSKANGPCSKLKIVEIPNDVEYEIEDYDGIESVHETHREWS